MEVGVDSPVTGREAGVAIDFPASDWTASEAAATTPMMPRRLRRRLLESRTSSSPSSVEEIEAKLRDADLRRQKFYEKLASKARPKPRSPSQSSSHEEDLGQRLAAKLQAAERKRLSILEKAQMRLAKLDELRQAAKSGVELRYREERAELGTKVESRVRQAEVNRMLILKAHKQRRATLKERTYQSLLRRMTRESKYKERIRAAIYQKRAAAEKKRLGFLEAEKKKARARVLQVHKVAKSVSHQREIERRKMMDKLEDRLQRAKRQRAEYLKQRARLRNSVQGNRNKMHKEADILSRKLARCWKRFLLLRRTTLDLTKAYDALNINEERVKSMPFEQLALLIESTSTLQTVKPLLDRFESRYALSRVVAANSSGNSSWDDIDHLLKRVASPKKRDTPRKSTQRRESKKPVAVRESAENSSKLSRYQVRIMLCAYMILGHPDAVFNSRGEHEIALERSAQKFVREFELLVKIVLDGPTQSSDEESDPALPRRWTFRSQLAAFDAEWCSYLNSFVAWKVKDARTLEDDLVRAACQLELSMMQTCKLTPEGETGALTHDMKAILKQVTEDQKLLRGKVQHLSGDAGIERMEFALSDTRTKYFQARENGSPVGSPPVAHILSLEPPSSDPPVASSVKRSDVGESSSVRPSGVVRSLFRDNGSFPSEGVDSASSSHGSDTQFKVSIDKMTLENEVIVNEAVHEQRHMFADTSNVSEEDKNSIKAKIRETMERAFWDGIIESMDQEEPKYERVVELMREVRDGICEIAPQSWTQEIIEAIDLDILTQVLNLGKLDMDYLGKILEFALVTLLKLSAPANEDEMKAAHQKLLNDLYEMCQSNNGSSSRSYIAALIKGLRFVLEQIQALKQEMSKARIRLMEPFLKGPAGLDYLKRAFSNRAGPPSNASTALPLTMRWLSSVCDTKDQEWNEHTNYLLELKRNQESSSGSFLPLTTLRTGGNISSIKMSGSPMTSSSADTTGSDNPQPECKGENVDLMVRLGLLNLVSGVSGLTLETLPETLKLNLSRLRSVQSQIQKTIVISTSILFLRQTLLSEQMVTNPGDMENMVSSCVKQLLELLDNVEDAGLEEIVKILGKFSGEKFTDPVKLQSAKNFMARMLSKSLQSGDPVFARVSRAVYLAARGIVLGGSGTCGRELAEVALRQVGAAVLMDMVVKAASVLILVATVSVGVHGAWYAHLVENM